MSLRKRKREVKEKDDKENPLNEHFDSIIKNIKYPKDDPKVPFSKLLVRCVFSCVLVLLLYWTSKKEVDLIVFANQKETLQMKSTQVSCSSEYLKEISKFKECAPKHCGRFVTDTVVSPEEVAHLLHLSKKGLGYGGSAGGASILDLHSGALSYGNSFINIYKKLKAIDKTNVFGAEDFKIYTNVRKKIQQSIAFNFGINADNLYLTHPTFFSQMTPRPPKTTHDEYWHVHIDKETYPSFHYTSLLYLSDYNLDFTGGRFIFVNNKAANVTVEPKMGRLSVFTSGGENPHYVEQVQSGTRYAMTVSFTCDPNSGIDDPSLDKFKDN